MKMRKTGKTKKMRVMKTRKMNIDRILDATLPSR
jgi:hypothetical protein